MSSTCFRFNLGVFLFLAISSALISAVPAKNSDGYKVIGRVKVEGGHGVKGYGVHSKTANVKVILNGGEAITFLRPDGYFSFFGIPAGTHLLEVVAMGYAFSPVRIDISARLQGSIQAYQTENFKQLTELVLEPLGEENYYEKREPFSIISLLKNPMVLIVGFMLVAVFLLPKLMEVIDAEEMRRQQEEMRNQPMPSLANFLHPRTN